jgi:hypothetical protein
VFYQGTLKWNQGVHNEMVYIAGNTPSGTYDPNRLGNLSFGYVAVDAGAGYAHATLLGDRPQPAIWVTSVRMRWEDRSSIARLILSQTSAGRLHHR